jgi:Branched-chain amino acid ABC-type transport system, permease components
MTIQILINGLALGSVYALISVGFALVFNVLKFSNFSYGALMTVGAFSGYMVAVNFKAPLPLVILAAVIVGGIVALVGELIAFRRITIRNTPTIYYFVSSITLGTLFESIVTIIAGPNFYNYPRFFKNPVMNFGKVVVSTSDFMMFLISASALILLVLVINKTKLGRALRSVSFDRSTATLMGIDSTRIIQFTFIISGMLGGLAGVFLGINYTLYPQLGSLVTKGFIASVIGGLGSISGAVIGAVLLGMTETLLINFVGSSFTPVFTFLIMLVFLIIRPRGIAGSNVQEKA